MGTCLVIGIVVVAVAFGPGMAPYVSHTLPNAKPDFIGRDQDMKILLEVLDFSNNSFRFVNIIGPPGFGKSALAINIGHTMLARRTKVHYINLIDFPEKNFKQVLAEKILINDDNNVEKSATFENLVKWGRRKRWWSNCLIILDNCDDSIEEQKEDFYYAIDTLLLHSGSNLKLLTTSREAIYHPDSHFVHRVHPIDVESACQMLELRNPSLLNDSEKTVIANLTGEVPLALKIVGALLSNRIHSVTEIIENLKEQPISALSPHELWSSMQLNVSISLSYNYLDQNVQNVGRYLAFFPGSFDLLTAVGTLDPLTKLGVISQIKLSLNKLVQLSLLEYEEKSHRYHYHKLIKDYFIMKTTSNEYGDFIVVMKIFYSVRLCEMTEEFKISPRVALHQLYADRHHIELLMAFISLNLYVEFDLSLAACFLEALKTKYLYCRFNPQDVIIVIHSFMLSFLESSKRYLQVNDNLLSVFFMAEDMASEFTIYADLIIELSLLLQGVDKHEEAVTTTKQHLLVINIFCSVDISKEACRKFYAHILTHYENKFDADTAKLYHIRFLEKTESSKTKCSSTDSAECDNIAIAISYSNLKQDKKAKKFFEKALHDKFQYPIFDRLYVLLWLHKNFRASTDVERVDADLKIIHHHLMNMTASELYGCPSYLLRDYQDYLMDINEHDKAHSYLEHWVEVMEEIGLASSHEEIKLAHDCAVKLYSKGYYNRSLNIVQHVLSITEANSCPCDYINFQQLRGSIMYWLKNFTESEKSFKLAIEHILLFNMTSNYSIFDEVCWDLLFYLHNFDYFFTCFTNRFIDSAFFVGEAFLYILFKSPLDYVPTKSPQESVKVDIPFEYFPSLIQQSHRTDLINSEAGEMFIYKPDFTVIVSSDLRSLLRVVWYFFINLIENNCLRLCCNFVSIFIRLVILKILLQLLCCLISTCFKLFLNFIYFSTLIFYVKVAQLL